MRILYLWDADYPWDIRAEKITRALLAAGHEVHLLARNRGRRARIERQEDGLLIHRVPALPQRFGPLNDPFTFPLFFSPLWLRELSRVCRREQIDLIIARDLPLAPAAVVVARMLKLPTLFDMAECYPEMLRNLYRFAPRRFGDRLIRNPALADAVERWVVKRVDRILVMIEESRNRLIARGVPPERISIVSNTPELERFEGTPPPPGLPYTISYIGLLGYSRGLDEALLGVAHYLRTGKSLRFVIAGTGRAAGRLAALARELGIGAQVEFCGWVENRQLPALVARSHACIVPHRRCPHWEHTIPNKLFDYMAAARPVLVTDVRPMARIVEGARCGIVYQDGDPAALAEALTALEDETLRRRLGENGRRAVEREYHWGRDAKVLLETVHACGALSRRALASAP